MRQERRNVLSYSENGEFVDALVFVVGLLHQVLVDVLEVGDGHVLLEVFVEDLSVVDQLDLLICHP